ncbi:MAG: hypothetical protein LBQ64_05725 [Bacteroidales bacterium]|jgi:hypothetical protein|nr:hypothetical protein [Bacteroidales bacterium]
MNRTKYRNLAIIFVITLIVAWTLGVLRFDYNWIHLLFKILLFPCGFLYMIYESYCTLHFNSSHFLNNEFFQMTAFVLSVAGQSLVYYWIFRRITSSLFNKRKMNTL